MILSLVIKITMPKYNRFEMTRRYKYMRKDFSGDLPARLKHMDITLSFFDERVEATACICIAANINLSEIVLDAKDLVIKSIKACKGKCEEGDCLDFEYHKDKDMLVVKLPKKLKKGEEMCIKTFTHCYPSETNLEGIYKDSTPPGAPQQFMSQCEMWGFSRIMPVIDDPRAKCTYRTTIEADARYTHLISNGNIDKKTNPDGLPVRKQGDSKRKVITYVNDLPMAPYLFIAAVGTWDELTDSVTYPDGGEVRLEYLVPPGRKEEATIPMEILKKSILWIAETQDYEYKLDTYRTITMNKSDAGGMENMGNTTIITDAALIDEHTVDGLLLYAYQVIVHEFEHNQCGSVTTMKTPFDMWLNEAYTVDVERQFSADTFNSTLIRLDQVGSVRGPLTGPLAVEDAGYHGLVVREGFNHPRELIDGVTYVKAAEVIRMMKLLLGEKFSEASKLYFSRYKDGNADTEQFFSCFEEVSGRSLAQFKKLWLYGTGYPKVTAKSSYDEKSHEFSIWFEQKKNNVKAVEGGRGKENLFHIPIELALVDSKGKDIEGTQQIFELTEEKAKLTIPSVMEEPSVVSLNRSYSFYGTFSYDATVEELIRQVKMDPNLFNRVEAMNMLTDIQRIKLMKDIRSRIDEWWLKLFGELLEDKLLPNSLKAGLIGIDEQPMDRRYLAWFTERYDARRKLMLAVNKRFKKKLVSLFNGLDTYKPGTLEEGIEDRLLKAVLLGLITVDDSPESHKIILKHLERSTTATDRVTSLLALNRGTYPQRREILEDHYESWKGNLSGYANYLRVVSQGASPDVWEMIEIEKQRDTMDLNQPTYSRALMLPMAFNSKMLWTDRGMEWVKDAVLEFSDINSTLASRLLNVFQLVNLMKPELKAKVIKHLEEIEERSQSNPTIHGQARAYLGR